MKRFSFKHCIYLLGLLGLIIGLISRNYYIISSTVVYLGIIVLLYKVLPSSNWHTVTFREGIKRYKNIIFIILIVEVLLSTILMSFCPYHNGEYGVRRIYENAAQSYLNGHLYIDNVEVDEKLIAMENPYDPALREELGVQYEWDYAWYNNHYYMYFGVVPCLLLFMPFQALTGTPLLAYHATQIFVALTIICFYLFFYKLTKKYSPDLPMSVFILLTISLSLLSVMFSITEPAMYCTALMGGVCFELWSIYFYAKGLFLEEKRSTSSLFLGALCGALVFGCRPPVALANVIVIPILIKILKDKQDILKNLFVIGLPYLIVGISLMIYNYVRFDSPFEFGQTYQLTLADQHLYQSVIGRVSLKDILLGMVESFFQPIQFIHGFPIISMKGSVFAFFPILLSVFLLFIPKVFSLWKKHKILWFGVTLFVIPLIIVVSQIVASPFLVERYHLDFYFIMSLLSFMNIGFFYQSINEKRKKIVCTILCLLSYFALGICFLMYFTPEYETLTYTYPIINKIMKNLFSFGLLGFN